MFVVFYEDTTHMRSKTIRSFFFSFTIIIIEINLCMIGLEIPRFNPTAAIILFQMTSTRLKIRLLLEMGHMKKVKIYVSVIKLSCQRTFDSDI